MRVTILSTFYPFRGGIAQFSASLFRALEKKTNVEAFTFKRQYPDLLFPGKTQLVEKGDQADVIPSERILDTINPITYHVTAKKINSIGTDLLITNYWMTFFAPAVGLVTRWVKPRTKKIAILHNLIPHETRFFDSIANRFFLKCNDGFVVMSDAVLNDLLSLKPGAKYLRIDHPVYDHFGEKIDQSEARSKLKLDTDKKTILFFGIIRDYKGLDILIQAFQKLDDSYQLLIAGEAYGSFEKYQNILDNSDSKARVHVFNRYIGDEDVSVYFSAADVCVLPYRSATQSGITAISNHFELPVIATDVGGLKEIIQHEETGLIVPIPEENLLKDAIMYYFEEGKKEVFSKNIKKEKSKRSWDDFANQLLVFAEKL